MMSVRQAAESQLSQAVMVDQHATGVSWPVRCGRMPVLADFYTPRPETGHGLDAPGSMAGHAGPAGQAGPAGPAGHAGPTVTVLTGPGGCGKTYLAAARMAAMLRSGSVDLAVWVHLSSRAAAQACFAQAAAELGLAGGNAPAEPAAAQLIDWLGRIGRRWLIVLDHVTDLAGLAGLWPASQAGQVIVTCRPSADVAGLAALPGASTVCQVGAFSAREALGFLTARLHADTDQRVEAVDLAEDLGHMPLALALASATMTGSTLSCRDYRQRFASRLQELAAWSGGQCSAVEVTWSLALDRAEQRAPAGLARPALALTAFLDPAGMSALLPATKVGSEYLAGPGGCDADQVRATLGSLVGCGLLGIDESVMPPLLTVHSEVQAAVRRFAPARALDNAARAAADALGEVWPALADDPVQAQALRDCTASMDEHVGALLWSPEPHPVLIQAGASLAEAGLAGAALTWWRSLADRCDQRLGPGHLSTLEVRDQLAAAYEAAGLVDDAIGLIQMTAAEREREQGADHPDALSSRASLAHAYLAAGRTGEAIELYEQVLAGRQWALGADHPDALACRSQLASAYLAAGTADRAIILFERNVAEWRSRNGPDHPQTVTEALNLGGAYLAGGKPAAAVAVYQQVRAVRERDLGREHPDTLTAGGQLAYAYRKAGRFKDAIACYRQTFTGRERTLGPDHPDTLTVLANLASCHEAARQAREAITLYEKVCAARERAQGPDHPDTLMARAMLAGAYHSAGRMASAVPAYEQAVADFERILGRDHPDTLTSRGNLAHAYHMARRHTDAITVFERTLADCERVLGPDHQLTRTIRENLAAAS